MKTSKVVISPKYAPRDDDGDFFDSCVSNLFYQLYNPTADRVAQFSFESNYERDDDIPESQRFESAVSTYALEEDAKEDAEIWETAKQKIQDWNRSFTSQLENDRIHRLVLVPVNLDSTSKQDEEKRREMRRRRHVEKRLEEMGEERKEQTKKQRRAYYDKRVEALQDEKRSRRERRMEKESTLSTKDRRRLDEVRQELEAGASFKKQREQENDVRRERRNRQNKLKAVDEQARQQIKKFANQKQQKINMLVPDKHARDTWMG